MQQYETVLFSKRVVLSIEYNILNRKNDVCAKHEHLYKQHKESVTILSIRDSKGLIDVWYREQSVPAPHLLKNNSNNVYVWSGLDFVI